MLIEHEHEHAHLNIDNSLSLSAAGRSGLNPAVPPRSTWFVPSLAGSRYIPGLLKPGIHLVYWVACGLGL